MHDNANGIGSCCSSVESAVTDPFDAYVVLSVSIPQGQQWIFRKFYLRRSLVFEPRVSEELFEKSLQAVARNFHGLCDASLSLRHPIVSPKRAPRLSGTPQYRGGMTPRPMKSSELIPEQFLFSVFRGPTGFRYSVG